MTHFPDPLFSPLIFFEEKKKKGEEVRHDALSHSLGFPLFFWRRKQEKRGEGAS